MNRNDRIDRNARRAFERELKELPTTPPPADLLDRIRREIPATPGASNADDGPGGAGAPRRPRGTRWLSLAAMLAVGALGATLAYRVSRDSGGADSLALRPASPPAPQATATVRTSEAPIVGESVAIEVAESKDEDVLLKEETDDRALAGRRLDLEAGPEAKLGESESRVSSTLDSPSLPGVAAAAGGELRRQSEAQAVPAEEVEQLRALGYFAGNEGTSGPEAPRPAAPAPATAAPAAAPSQEVSRRNAAMKPAPQAAQPPADDPGVRASQIDQARRSVAELERELRRLQSGAGTAVASEAPTEKSATGRLRAEAEPAPPADMYFRDAGTNPFVDAREDRLSTFALDVDTGAWTLARSYLERGMLPPREAIRVEEFVNAQAYEDPAPRRGEFTLTAEGAPSPFVPDDRYRLLRFAVKAREVDASDRKPANLTFVVDVSGSMDRENRLGLVKRALGLLLDELDSEDRVGLVVYGSRGRVLLEHTRDHEAIRDAIRRLVPEGSTNAEEGLRLGYDLADRAWREGWINRIILCSDGVANVGATGPESILARIGKEARRGIALTTVGFGMGNYNDELMEQLADQGDGSYHYVDQLDEARRVFVENLSGTLQTVARDAKVQVEFDPRSVERWRLVGYENRDVADRDFRNDRIDAGEVGAGQSATAVYEVRLSEDARAGDPLATLRLRWKSVDGGRVVEADQELTVGDVGRSFDRASRDLRVAAIAADFAERLKGTRWSRDGSWSDLVAEARHLRRELPRDATVTELARLVERAAGLAGDGSDSDRRRME